METDTRILSQRTTEQTISLCCWGTPEGDLRLQPVVPSLWGRLRWRSRARISMETAIRIWRLRIMAREASRCCWEMGREDSQAPQAVLMRPALRQHRWPWGILTERAGRAWQQRIKAI